jgi:hypothetical protein
MKWRLPLGAAVCLILLLGGGVVRAEVADDGKPWLEADVTLPAFPQNEDLVEFYVSATTRNRFFIDARTLNVGSDGVVRYALVVLTAGGATNVSYEGIRCSSGEVRLYATGRADRKWAPARVSEWAPIENKTVNRHHAALSREYFCPGGVPIASAAEGRNALRSGQHPRAN